MGHIFTLLHSNQISFDLAITVPIISKCQAVIDVGFILDSSGSLRNNYEQEKEFLKSLASTFGVSSNGSRAGVVTFSYFSEHSIKLSDHSDIASFNQAVDEIPLMGSTTRIDKALRLAQKELFSLGNGGRPGVPKLLILLTDGTQTQDAGAEDPGDVAEELRADGINILVVGIGRGVNETELTHIAGEEKSVYSAASFESLVENDFIESVTTRSCDKGTIFMTITS